jgi:hydrogenase 3 maturation protease
VRGEGVAESWRTALSDRLSEPAVIVGIGNSQSGDDGVGPEVVRLLAGRTRATLFDCQTAPENFIGPIARAKPRCIVLVDAAPFEDVPGAISVFALECLHQTTFHTHASTPALFLDLLVERTGAQCFMIGVQPEQSGLGTRISPRVSAAAAAIADAIAELLPPTEGSQ